MLKKVQIFLVIILFGLIISPLHSFANGKATEDMTEANKLAAQSLQLSKTGDMDGAAKTFKEFSSTWLSIEDGVKDQSAIAYKEIEDAMGQVQFAFAQQPVKAANVTNGLTLLMQTNQKFIDGKFPPGSGEEKKGSEQKINVASLVTLLDHSLKKIDENDINGAKADIEQFRKSWLEVEGSVLTQSSKVYSNSERDMVTSYALLNSNKIDEAKKTIKEMRNYLAPLAMKSSYNMMDAVTILLREGLEALLVIVALLGFLKKSGHEDKKQWIWMGVGSGVGVSIILGIIVNLLFSAGTFGSNNFLIAGWTGIFAAAMLLYMSYWLHSKSSIAEWQRYIHTKSTNALNTGSLFSLAALSFLAVFREGTETVLFFIGMANSIKMPSLLTGIGIGVLILIILSYFILKVGLRIPMRPFFLVSSILMFYLCFKFAGMGIHGLQLAGLLPVTQISSLPTIDFLAFYPTVQSIIPQAFLLVVAIIAAVLNKKKDINLKIQLRKQGDLQNAN
ncbi:FTR1 family iron permease [Fictibacillus barbaricus]|uniref:High-affinity iron transporter n=1 Tax=Fictibacillus barbaricus TaxID=182136 RepID=A0ABU1TV45_9BACL|nr:FTR1 family protein [Fictibacillus barbaricus]MDR7071073.1 high-affinity iron transporter [Fictibacillus barbaricus]